MGVKDELRQRWFVATLSIAAAVFFSAALIFSAATYLSVMDTRLEVEFRDAVETAELLTNGSLVISLTIVLDNPSRQELVISSISWNVKVYNVSDTGTTYIPMTSHFGVSPEYSVLRAHEAMTIEREGFVVDQEKLASLSGYINHSASEGLDLTMESVPYVHDFRVVAWISDFDHDYQYSKEAYLNDMVKIERTYLGGLYL